MSKPIIGITMGDGAGVGPEIIMKALDDAAMYEQSRPFVIGDAKLLERASKIVGDKLQVRSIASVEEAKFEHGVVDCLDLNLLPADLPFGAVRAEAGHAAFMYLKQAIELANQGAIDAICTAPLNKEALHKGGHIYPGHTEILAELTGTKDYSMMLSAPKLKVIHVTTHVGIIDAVKQINPDRVYKVIRLAHETLQKAGYAAPKIAVCGINPHAGENGLFGYGEEEEKIAPAVRAVAAEGHDVVGPLPADTAFFLAGRGDYDLIVAMYHDQGHGPVKVLGIEAGTNITVGLPVIRTSVDHGTAFDIAGTGRVDPRSMIEALRQAAEMSQAPAS